MNAKVKPVREWERILVRVPDGMRDDLEDMAAENCVPLNGQILFVLKNAIEARKAASNPTA